MSRPTDFSDDLAAVSKTVNTDVDAIIKLVRQKDAKEGDSHLLPLQSGQTTNLRPTHQVQLTQPKPAKHRPARVRTIVKALQEEQIILENVTTRLRRDTNERLTEAALRQKLKKEVPATRQDIIEAALQEWFQRNGYESSVATQE